MMDAVTTQYPNYVGLFVLIGLVVFAVFSLWRTKVTSERWLKRSHSSGYGANLYISYVKLLADGLDENYNLVTFSLLWSRREALPGVWCLFEEAVNKGKLKQAKALWQDLLEYNESDEFFGRFPTSTYSKLKHKAAEIARGSEAYHSEYVIGILTYTASRLDRGENA